MQRCSVLLIRSDHLGWAELRHVIEAMPDLRLVGQEASASRALELAADLQPDIIIADSRLGRSSNLPLLIKIGALLPGCRFVIVSAECDAGDLSQLAALGVVGHLLWNDLTPKVLHHLITVLTYSEIVCASQSVVDIFMPREARGPEMVAKESGLTEREYAILRRLAQGYTEKQIAREEDMGLRSVERAVNDLKIKLDVSTSFTLAVKALKLGLIQQ